MDGPLLSDLKVADLRRELEKRRKDKAGVKQVLIDRLREALEESGLDPLTYRFGSAPTSRKSNTCKQSTTPDREAVGGGPSGAIPSVDLSESMADEPVEPKKISEESIPYVVQVGDQEDDLDYDLKAESGDSKPLERNIGEESNAQSGKSPPAVIDVSETHRNLWVSNLPKNIKAADLKQHFSKAGKVLSATVAMSTKAPGGCFGFLQMSSAEDAEKAARLFNGTEYDGYKLKIEVTDKKPPTLSLKSIAHGTTSLRSKMSSAAPRRPVSRGHQLERRRRVGEALRRYQARRPPSRPIAERSTEVISDKRTTRPLTMNPSLLAYQSLKRASRLLAARYGMVRRLQAVERSLACYRDSRNPVRPRLAPRQRTPPTRRRGSANREPRQPVRSETPVHRSAPRPFFTDVRRRSSESRAQRVSRLLPSPRFPPSRHSEPGTRQIEPSRPRRPLPLSPPLDRRRLNYPSTSRSPAVSRNGRDHRLDQYANSDREFVRPSHPIRSRAEQRSIERMQHNRSPRITSSADRVITPPRGSTYEVTRFKSTRETPIAQRTPPRPPSKSSPVSYRRQYKHLSRSPPRSRVEPNINRPYTSYLQPRVEREIRERSPLHNSAASVRPKVVDYGHRSEPRSSWPQYKSPSPSISAPPGHTWKPAGHTMVSSYGSRGPSRRYM